MTDTLSLDLAEPTPAVSFVEDDLVVAAAHQRVVEAELASLQIRYAPDGVVPGGRLGLTLLRNLKGLPGRAQQIRAAHRAEITELEQASGRSFSDLDALLFDLRKHFSEKFGGWVPLMGKNRDVHSIVPFPGGGGSRIQGVGVPESADAPEHWASGSAGSGVLVGVLDTPVHSSPVLAGHLADGVVLAGPASSAVPYWEGHATFVASRILKRAPRATLDMRPLLRDEGRATAWDTAMGMVGFLDAEPDGRIAILNLSLGCRTADGQPPLVLSRAVDQLSPDVLIVAAAGNHGDSDHPSAQIWPAALPDVIAVGAAREPGSEFSPELPWITCIAPGFKVLGAYLTGTVAVKDRTTGITVDQEFTTGYATWSGTSFAAATVTGAIAAAKGSTVTAREALGTLLTNGDPDVARYTPPHCA